jgi:hypothetical protein
MLLQHLKNKVLSLEKNTNKGPLAIRVFFILNRSKLTLILGSLMDTAVYFKFY